MIGDLSAAEWRHDRDPHTHRSVTQLTSASGHSYPLYYFGPAVTSDGRYVVFHSERSGWVQLYRLDLITGEIGQLTDGRTWDSGWAIWCEWRLRGVYNHLSALDPRAGHVYYFQDDEVRRTDVRTFDNRVVTKLPSRHMPVGQSAFSPSGSLFAFIHVEAEAFTARLRERECRVNSGLYAPLDEHEQLREGVRTVLSVIDCDTGEMRTVIETDFHFHHVGFIDETSLLLNHPRGCHGMWTVDTDGGNIRHLRPATAPDAAGAEVVHQHVTERGIAYEAVSPSSAVDAGPETERTTYLGLYDRDTEQFNQLRLPVDGYVHVGRDPRGEFWFIERTSRTAHELLSVERVADPAARTNDATATKDGVARIELLRTLGFPAHQQRRHGHPFLSPDRTKLLFTDRTDGEFSQIYCMDVADLT